MKRLLLCAIFGMPFLAASGGAIAEDDKTFPGASCLSETNALAIIRDSSGRMFNTSTAAQNWICPIVRDSVSLPLEFAAIDVIDTNVATGDPNVTCKLNSRSRIGTFVASETHATAGAPAGVATLSYAVGTPDLAAADKGYYYFSCSIPGTFLGRRSGIVSYRTSEN